MLYNLVRALIRMWLDYCNGLCWSEVYTHEKLILFLSSGPPPDYSSAATSILCGVCTCLYNIYNSLLHHTTTVALETPDRIKFKLCTLVCRSLHGLAPRYICLIHARLQQFTLTCDHLGRLVLSDLIYNDLLPGTRSQCICAIPNFLCTNWKLTFFLLTLLPESRSPCSGPTFAHFFHVYLFVALDN